MELERQSSIRIKKMVLSRPVGCGCWLHHRTRFALEKCSICRIGIREYLPQEIIVSTECAHTKTGNFQEHQAHGNEFQPLHVCLEK